MKVKLNHTILCVDDDQDDRQLLQEALNEVGSQYHIVEALNGEDALKKLQQMKASGELPCLIVLDVNMPKLDGKQTLVSIQKDEVLSEIPVVVLSTSSSELDKLFFTRKKVGFITKPIVYNHLLEIATQLLNYCR